MSLWIVGCRAASEDVASGETDGSGGSGVTSEAPTGESGGPASCEAPPSSPAQYTIVRLDDGIAYDEPVRLDVDCRLESISDFGEGRGAFHLRCQESEGVETYRNLSISADPGLLGLPAAYGEPLRLRVHTNGREGAGEYIAVHDADGALVLAYASGEALPGGKDPDGSLPAADFFAPLEVAVQWPCPSSCSDLLFVIQDCDCVTHGAIDLRLAGQAEWLRLFDREHGWLGDLDVRVMELKTRDPVTCSEVPAGGSGVSLWLFAARLLGR